MFAKKSAFSMLSVLLVVLLLSNTVSASPLKVAVDKQSVSSPQYSLKGKMLNAPKPDFHEDFNSSPNLSSCTPPPSGMVAWWSGDNNALDMVGGNHGTLTNEATFAPGMVGEAFSFDGVNDYVEMPSGVGEFGSNAFTIDFWMYSNNEGSNTYIMGKSDPNGGQGFDIRLNNNKIQVTGVYGWSINITSDASATLNAWHHIALSSTSSTVDLYIDGVLKDTSARSAISATSNPFRVGYTTNYGGTAFNGQIDEVEIFNRALSASEIAAIYNAGSGGKCRSCAPVPANIVSWWDAEGNADDIMGTNNGTLINGATFGPGKVEQAFSFDGADDYVTVPDSIVWAFGTNDFSIDLWSNFTSVKTGSYGALPNVFVGQDEGGGLYNKWVFYLADDGLDFHINGSASVYIGHIPFSPIAGQWYHLFLTRSGSTYSFYVNGKLLGAASDATPVPDVNAPLIIGQAEGLGYFHGLHDEIQIFNRALSAAEIAAIYNAGSEGCCMPDNIPPTIVSVVRADPNPTNAANVDFTLTFSESVTGVDTTDFTLTKTGTVVDETVSTVTGGPTVYTITVSTGSGDGTLRLDVNASGTAIQDLAGNPISGGFTTGEAYDIDKTAPTVTISSLAPDPTNATPISVTVDFSETVTGFAVEDIATSNGTVSNFVAVDGDSYTFDLSPNAQGSVTADIAAEVASDLAGNTNTAATQFSRVYDNVAPSVTMNSAASDPTKNSPISVTVQFSETVTGFASGDIVTSNGTVNNFVAEDGDTYTFELTPSAQGSVTADIAAEVATDLAGNTNTAATQFSRVYDNIAPSVTMSSAVPNPTDALPIPVTVQFSKTVTGFTADDILTSNGAVSNFVAVDGDTFTFELIPSAKGSVTADIAAGVASDSVGNGNTAAAQFSRTYAPLEKLFLPLILR